MGTNLFTDDRWLCTEVAGNQPGLGENYINIGSLYLCSTMFLPLGLSPADIFLSSENEDWTSRKVWNGAQRVIADRAL